MHSLKEQKYLYTELAVFLKWDCAYSNAQGAAVKTKTFGTPCKIQISNIHIPKTGHANVILQNVLGIFLRVQLGAVQI